MNRMELKNRIEAFAGHRYWIDRASERDRLMGLIAMLRPKGTVAPLIRVGSAEDGGYLVPDDLEGIAAAVSPGVNQEITFDLDMAARGIDVYMADASVNGPPQSHPSFHFRKKFLDVVNDDTNIRLEDFCAGIPASQHKDMILQMDIEGAEWRVLLDTPPALLERFRIMVIEFHGLQDMFSRGCFPLIEAVFRKLLAAHAVVHNHPNNCAGCARFHGIEVPLVTEMTFYRKDRGFSEEAIRTYPHPLDVNNVPGNPTLVLPLVWR